jgi:hypothetical protein
MTFNSAYNAALLCLTYAIKEVRGNGQVSYIKDFRSKEYANQILNTPGSFERVTNATYSVVRVEGFLNQSSITDNISRGLSDETIPYVFCRAIKEVTQNGNISFIGGFGSFGAANFYLNDAKCIEKVENATYSVIENAIGYFDLSTFSDYIQPETVESITVLGSCKNNYLPKKDNTKTEEKPFDIWAIDVSKGRRL